MNKIPILIRTFLTLAIFNLIMGCTSSPLALEYAKQSLAKRSPTLPENVSAWMPIYGFALSKDSSGLIIPLQWEQGYTKRLTLIWMPVPLQIRYLIHEDNQQWITTEVALFGSNYSRSRDYNWRPSIMLAWKKMTDHSIGIESKLLFQAEVKRGYEEPFSRTLSWQNGILFSITSWLDANPSFYIWNEKGEVRSQYLGEIPSSLSGAEAQNTHWRFPLSMKTVARFSKQAEVHAEVRYYRLGYSESYTEVPVFMTFVYYW